MNNELKITMIGAGYVGLVTGLCFAELGFQVTCYDKDSRKLERIKKGDVPIFEPKLTELIHPNLRRQRLHFANTLSEALRESQIIFIAVGTPTHPKTGQADLCFIEQVAEELAPLLQSNQIIVVKSTVPVGTGQYIKKIIHQYNPNAQFSMVSNPEFLREGSAVFDFMNPDRIIVGTETKASQQIMNQLYQHFIDQGVPMVYSNLETAEMIKYTANCFLATRLAFVNEMANLCEKLEADIEKVMLGVGLDKRIGKNYLKPGPGFGGSCFPKDTLALNYTANHQETPCQILEAVIHSNEARKLAMVKKIIHACEGSVQGKTLAILGVAFKANTDDVRDSAALTVIQGLQAQGALIRAFDPKAMEKAAEFVPAVYWAKDSFDAIKGSHAVVILTEWEIFENLNLKQIYDLLSSQTSHPTLIDLRNLYSPQAVVASGLRYFSVGRPVVMGKVKSTAYVTA